MSHDADTALLDAALRGRYLVKDELGRGGMGIVYLARDLALERAVAIKLLPGDLARLPELRARFLREARTAAGLSHPHIVPVYAVEEHGEVVCFMMALVPGGTLAARVREEGPLPPAEVSRLVQEVAWALAYAHQHGVIHRDIKPENILLERGSQRALVTDFGIARVRETSGSTPAGDLLGTPRLTSPEQAGGEPVDGRSDLYSLGVTAFFALTGRYPFEGDNAGALLAQHLTIPAPPVATLRPGVPHTLAAAIDRCLAKAPSDRFPNGEALAAALAAGSAIAPVPRTLHQISRELSTFGVDLVGFQTLAALAILTQLLTRDFLGFGLIYTVAVATLLVSILALRGIQVSRLIHDAAREGWTAGDLAAVVEREAREQADSGTPTPALRRPVALYLTGFLALALFWLGPKQWVMEHSAFPVVLLVELLSLALPVALGRWLGGILDAPRNGRPGLITSFFLKLKSGWLFRVMGRGAAARPTALSLPNQPTEMLLAGQARAMLRALPPAERERMGATEVLLQGLERDAMLLRRRLGTLDDAAGAVGGSATAERRQVSEEIERAREEAAGRLGTTVNALETLRLELLRAQAGLGGSDGLTGNLAELRHVADQIDAALETRKR